MRAATASEVADDGICRRFCRWKSMAFLKATARSCADFFAGWCVCTMLWMRWTARASCSTRTATGRRSRQSPAEGGVAPSGTRKPLLTPRAPPTPKKGLGDVPSAGLDLTLDILPRRVWSRKNAVAHSRRHTQIPRHTPLHGCAIPHADGCPSWCTQRRQRVRDARLDSRLALLPDTEKWRTPLAEWRRTIDTVCRRLPRHSESTSTGF